MRLWIKVLIILVVTLIAFSIVAYVFISLKGKAIIVNKLEGLTQRKIVIDSLNVTPPLNFILKNLKVEGIGSADSVYISPSIIGLLSGNIILNDISIVRPEFSYALTLPMPAGPSAGASAAAPKAMAQRKEPPLPLMVKRVSIKEGQFNFIDRTVSQEEISITVKDINFNLNNSYAFPHSIITNFELAGNIPWKEGNEEGRIEAHGWVNFLKKDMQADLKITDIDAIYLYPYYSGWVDLEKARIEKAKLNFTSKMLGLNNEVTAQCHLELSEIAIRPRSPEEREEKAEKITHAVLDIFKALNEGKVALDFTIKTKMNKPEFSFGDIRMAFEDRLAQGRKGGGFKVQDVLMVPGNILQGTVKSATDVSKAVIDGAFSLGKELKKATEGAFRREKEDTADLQGSNVTAANNKKEGGK